MKDIRAQKHGSREFLNFAKFDTLLVGPGHKCFGRWLHVGMALLVLSALGASGADFKRSSPLSRPIGQFTIGNTNVLNAILWFGRDNHLCFGIEFSGPELNRNIHLKVDHATVGEVVRKILGSPDAYQLFVADGVILIRKKGVKAPAWLDIRMPLYVQPRAELMRADIGLWGALESKLYESAGTAGDYPSTDPVVEVGPFRERGKTIRQLLVKMTGASKCAGWFLSGQEANISFPASINRLWTLAICSGRTAMRPQ